LEPLNGRYRQMRRPKMMGAMAPTHSNERRYASLVAQDLAESWKLTRPAASDSQSQESVLRPARRSGLRLRKDA
jgi:hypothetical protein